ncbi:MAG: Aspartyl/glutamyl-tRNA(Asn/Gln) amidotransferase subunit C [Pelotomaculum sp. PtaU1.Bin035]|nr:MAG: Aspartyl/glutamyl-tRNA(Asn/Gln) amidotransferase subunit C [Pelotomaculum sp. PtaU1.Bin035]
MITEKDVDHVALLGRLELTGEEKEMFTKQLNDILGHFQSLERLDTEKVQPTAHVLPLQNVYREDQVGRHISREDALVNCPDRNENYFKVPRII